MRACFAAIVLMSSLTASGNAVESSLGVTPATPTTPTTSTLPIPSIPSIPSITPEEVIVAAPEPRYVAPTLRDRIGRIWAPVVIDGQGPFRLVLDTGANRSVVTHTVVQQLGRDLTDSKTVKIHGITGQAHVPIMEIDSLEVGDMLLEGRKLPVVQDVFGGAEGALGTEGFADKRIFIDFRRDAISILRSRREPPPPGFTKVPVQLRNGRLLMFEISLGGVRTKALLDTGAQTTIGNNKLRDALQKRIRSGQSQSVVGVTLDVAVGEVFTAPPVYIGDITIKGMRVTFSDLFIFDTWKLQREPALLIGMDVIGVLDAVVIDYRQKEIHLKARR
jgi:predicted aspartyl protease